MEEEPKHNSIEHGANLVPDDHLRADRKPIISEITGMSKPSVDARRDEDVVIPLSSLGYVVETLARLCHGYTTHDLAHDNEEEARGDCVCA